MERKLTRPLEGAQSVSDNHDAFAFGGDQSESGDARVVALFHDWLDACRATDRRVDDDDQTEYDAAVERMNEIEDQIAATPGGPKALAIKTYLWHKNDLCNWVPDSALVCFPELFKEEGEAWRADLTVSTFRDAAKQVPELAELFAPIIHEDAPLIDAEIIIQWCQQMVSRNEHRDCRAEVAEKLSKALDRIERIPAETARGEAIKAQADRIKRQGGASALIPEADRALFALISEYRRREALAEEFGIDDAERARRCDDADEVREQIGKIRPTTLRGVLAVLDFGSEIEREDPDYWPDEAIEGLRAIVKQDGQL